MTKATRFGNARKLLTGALLATNLIGCIERAPIGQETVGDTTYTAWTNTHDGYRTIVVRDTTNEAEARWEEGTPQLLKIFAPEDHPFNTYSVKDLAKVHRKLSVGRYKFYLPHVCRGDERETHIIPFQDKHLVIDECKPEEAPVTYSLRGYLLTDDEARDVQKQHQGSEVAHILTDYFHNRDQHEMDVPEAFIETVKHYQDQENWLVIKAFRGNETPEVMDFMREHFGPEGFIQPLGSRESLARH